MFWLLIIHAGATWFMTGLIWFVQIVHYPLLRLIPESDFVRYEQRHTELTSWVVGPMMLIEGFTGIALCWFVPIGIEHIWPISGVIMLIIIAASTFWIQVPCHNQLCRQYDHSTQQKLVRTNWLRTLGWTARAVIVGVMLAWTISHDSK